jgi:hypothetical protein
MFTKEKIERLSPHLVDRKTLAVEPILHIERSENDEPIPMKSMTDKALPQRTKERMLIELPNWK